MDNFKYFNPQKKSSEEKMYSDVFDTYCEMFDVTYIYAIEVDVKTRSEKYLAIGFGKNASKDAEKTRSPEVVVKGKLTDEEIDVYSGKKKSAVVHEVTPSFLNSVFLYTIFLRYGRASGVKANHLRLNLKNLFEVFFEKYMKHSKLVLTNYIACDIIWLR